MAHIVFSTQAFHPFETSVYHDAVIVAKEQRVSDSSGSVVRIDVHTPSETVCEITGKKNKARLMHSAYWLEPDEAIRLAEMIKAAAVMAKHGDRASRDLFERMRFDEAMNRE